MDQTRTPKRPRGRPPTGAPVPAAERMRKLRERRRAAGLKAVTTWVAPDDRASAPYSSHRVLEARSLAMHVLIVRKIDTNPALLAIARDNLTRWARQREGEVPAWLTEWQGLMQRPWPAIAALLTEQSENAVRLRQSTPFAGVLTDEERARVYEAFRP